MLTVLSRADVPEYMRLKKETDELVGRINGKYAIVNWTPIWYYYRAMDFDDLIDLYMTSDIAMITPVRDGMNLVAKSLLSRVSGDGVLILSEMAGASKELLKQFLSTLSTETQWLMRSSMPLQCLWKSKNDAM